VTNRPHQISPVKSTTEPELNRMPGWPEILTGLGAAAAVIAALALLAPFLPTEPVAYGLTLAAWSAGIGFVGFGAAFAIRIRSFSVFGVRRTTWRWVFIGLGAGIVAFLLKGVVNAIIIALGFSEDAQIPFQEAGNGGVLALIVTFVCLSFLVPFGEELLFRGVVMRGLLRYGAWVAVLGSSVIFALFHGINLALPTALVVGIIAAEVARRSGSIWPAVVVHVVNNLGLPLFVLILGLGSAG
jgi:membrane protease YdiL (CAAX protease family)